MIILGTDYFNMRKTSRVTDVGGFGRCRMMSDDVGGCRMMSDDVGCFYRQKNMYSPADGILHEKSQGYKSLIDGRPIN